MKTGFSGAAPQAKKQVALLHFSGQSAVWYDQDTAAQLEGQNPYNGLLSIESLSKMWLYQLLRILYFVCVIFLPVVLDTGLQVCTIRSYCDIPKKKFQVWNGIEINSIDFGRTVEWRGNSTFNSSSALEDYYDYDNPDDRPYYEQLQPNRSRRQVQVKKKLRKARYMF